MRARMKELRASRKAAKAEAKAGKAEVKADRRSGGRQADEAITGAVATGDTEGSD